MPKSSSRPMCRALDGMWGGPCFRHASVLSTDTTYRYQFEFRPVCKVHLRQAITSGLTRSRQLPSGYRLPIQILPLDNA